MVSRFLPAVSDLYAKAGVWIQTAASLTFLVSSSFLDGALGWVFFVISILVLISDPLVILAEARRRNVPVQSGYLWSLGLLVLAIAIYFVRTKMNLTIDTIADADDSWLARVRRLLLAIFFLSYVGFFIYRLFICLGEGVARVPGAADVKRRTVLQKSLISIFAALPLFVLANYLPQLRNPSVDLTPGFYSFGEASRTILKSIPSDVQVTVFLPDQQAMKDASASKTQPELFRISEDIRVMAEQLPVINSKLKVTFKNADLDLAAVQDFGSVNNGTFVFRVLKTGVVTGTDKPYIERRVYVFNESDMERLEREIVRAAIQVSTPERSIYFTAANGERWEVGGRGRSPGAVETLKDALRFMNYQLKPLDTQTKWPGPIPDDAAVVIIAGPQVPFASEAKTAIADYMKKGGKVLASIDPAGTEDLGWLLELADSRFRLKRATLTSEPMWPGVPVTDSLESHRITENLTLAGRAYIVFPESGYFAESLQPTLPGTVILQQGDQKLKQSIFLYTKFNTILDANRNGKKDPAEEQGRYPLGLAFEYPDHTGTRLVIFSGIGWMTELGLRFPIDQRNMIMAQDSISFLLESPLAAGLIPEQRKNRSIPVTDSLKFKNILLGMVLFPFATGAVTAFAVWFYRKRRAARK